MTTSTIRDRTGFVEQLHECQLITTEDLRKVQAYLEAFPQRGQADLAEFLVGQKMLTRFQADAALQGKAEELVLSRFLLVDVLGSGSLGTCYKARGINQEGDFWYAIKIVPRRNAIGLNTVAEKVKVLKEVKHPRVCSLVHIGAVGERVYLVWPFLEGGERLDDLIQRQGKMSPRQAIQVGLQVASGLQAYHEHGLFHGLLKPSDILIGADKRVRILDLGVGFLVTSERGKSLLNTMTNTKLLARGVDCSSPESIMDPLDRTPAGDQYSLGCILYYCLTGQYPFPDNNPVKKMLAHQTQEPQPIRELNSEVTPALASFIKRLMRKTPQERFESTDEVVQTLQTLNAPGRGSTPWTAASPGPSSRPPSGSVSVKGAAPKPASESPKRPTPRPMPKPLPAESPESTTPWSTSRLVVLGLVAGVVLGLLTWLTGRI